MIVVFVYVDGFFILFRTLSCLETVFAHGADVYGETCDE